jgi:glyoxylase-like metal-dependent hydrolase (beta-lactamase superfamily II)
MPRATSRRTFILGGAAAALALGSRAWAQAPAAISAAPLAEGVLLFTGAGCNVLAIDSSDGVTLVDGGLAGNSAALLAAVSKSCGGRPVRTLFNTHWHSDHTGSNEALGRAGATIIAHENTRRWLSSRVYRELQDRTYPPRPPEALPTKTLTAKATLTAGTTRMAYGGLPPAHTSGDIYVLLPDHNVLMVSDVLTPGRYPVMDYSTGGWIGGLIDAATVLRGIANDTTRFVPGLGPMQTLADLTRQREMLVTVRDRVWTMIRQGKSLKEVAKEAPTREFDAQWGESAQFLEAAYVGLVRHSHELGGVL